MRVGPPTRPLSRVRCSNSWQTIGIRPRMKKLFPNNRTNIQRAGNRCVITHTHTHTWSIYIDCMCVYIQTLWWYRSNNNKRRHWTCALLVEGRATHQLYIHTHHQQAQSVGQTAGVDDGYLYLKKKRKTATLRYHDLQPFLDSSIAVFSSSFSTSFVSFSKWQFSGVYGYGHMDVYKHFISSPVFFSFGTPACEFA